MLVGRLGVLRTNRDSSPLCPLTRRLGLVIIIIIAIIIIIIIDISIIIIIIFIIDIMIVSSDPEAWDAVGKPSVRREPGNGTRTSNRIRIVVYYI